MSDLQISLIIIGAIIIAGVAIFNWVQQIQYQRNVKKAFEHDHEDALLKPSKSLPREERIEPKFSHQPDKSELEPVEPEVSPIAISSATATSTTAAFEQKPIHIDSVINYITSITTTDLITHDKLTELLQQKFDFGKPVSWYGLNRDLQAWEEITIETLHSRGFYSQLKGCLQLADRAGPVSEVNLSKFRDMVEDFASQLNVTAECPDIAQSHANAIALDKFCAEVDVVLGINVVSKDGGAFVGTKIRALAEASGFKLESEGMFRYRDENNIILFSLCNYETTPFSPANMRTLTTHGITFLFDVPRVANGEKVFEQMAHLARLFASTLNGIMVDDNRVPLSDNGIKRSKQQLKNIQSAMSAHNIPAGSDVALRLFV